VFSEVLIEGDDNNRRLVGIVGVVLGNGGVSVGGPLVGLLRWQVQDDGWTGGLLMGVEDDVADDKLVITAYGVEEILSGIRRMFCTLRYKRSPSRAERGCERAERPCVFMRPYERGGYGCAVRSDLGDADRTL
jgi:hypothetical protein